jgi:hypothetical protein
MKGELPCHFLRVDIGQAPPSVFWFFGLMSRGSCIDLVGGLGEDKCRTCSAIYLMGFSPSFEESLSNLKFDNRIHK